MPEYRNRKRLSIMKEMSFFPWKFNQSGEVSLPHFIINFRKPT